MLLRIVVAASFVFALPSCVSSTRQAVAGPDGTPHSYIECFYDRADCYSEAATVCPQGYAIVDTSSGSLAAGSAEKGGILIRCIEPKPEPDRAVEEEARQRIKASVKAPIKASVKDAPLGAGGFEFGETLIETEQACRESDHAWAARDDHAVCGGAVSKRVDRPMKTVLEFCDDFLCRVELRVEPDGDKKKDKTWVREVTRLRGELAHKYGPWTKSVKPASWCRDDILACLADGRANYRYEWAWETGEQIVLAVENASDSKLGPAVKITYTTPERAESELL